MSHTSPEAGPAAENLVFFGAITASVSHELKNALATINEFSGLLGDLTAAAATKGAPPNAERLSSICEKIDKQVKRAEELIRRLNRFAHSADVPVAEVDVRHTLSAICDLCERFAKLARVTFERRFGEGCCVLALDPFSLQHAIYLAIRIALGAAAQQRTMCVVYQPDADLAGCKVLIESADGVPAPADDDPDAALLRALCAHLGATIRWAEGRIVLCFPPARSAGTIEGR